MAQIPRTGLPPGPVTRPVTVLPTVISDVDVCRLGSGGD